MPGRIPNQFHFVFGLRPQTEPFHLAYYLCLESCRRVNAPERLWFHYHNEPFGPYWDLIKPWLNLTKVKPVTEVSNLRYSDSKIGKYSYAHHADFIRLEALDRHGGIYADMDTLFVNRVPDALYEEDYVLGREAASPDERTGARRASLCNAFIMAQEGARFGKLWLEEMPGALDGARWSNHSCVLANQLAERHPDLVHIEPQRTFYKHMWTRDGLRTLFEGLDRDFEGVVSMHLWSHLWWEWSRRDFSSFHAGLINPRRVRARDTTYNIAARRFLPAPGTISRAALCRAGAMSWARKARTLVEGARTRFAGQ